MADSYVISTCPRGGRPLVEAALCLRVRDLRRPGCGWVAPDLVAADGTVIRARVEVAGDTAAWLHVEHWRPGATWATYSYTVALLSTPQRLGGVRWWLSCPLSGVRASALYLPASASSFGSRQAHGLAHASQRHRGPARATARARRLAAALGVSGLDAAPVRPKGMWRSTFDRRTAALARLIEASPAF